MSESGTEIRRRFEVHLGNGRIGHRKLRGGRPKPGRIQGTDRLFLSRSALLSACASREANAPEKWDSCNAPRPAQIRRWGLGSH